MLGLFRSLNLRNRGTYRGSKYHLRKGQLDLQHVKLVITYSFKAILQTVSEDL